MSAWPREPVQRITLDSEDDAEGFRAAARRLLVAGVEPDRVQWRVATAVEDDLFGHPAESEEASMAPAGATGADAPALTLPAPLLGAIRQAALHADRDRHALLYRLLWRLAHEPGLRHDPLDPDRLSVERLSRAVRRDMHKMTAFVRFRPIVLPTADGVAQRIRHVAWFEPEHHIVEATAPFFARRFAQMDWAILTPERCVRWDGQALQFGPGARRDEAPDADAAERLWLTYYESIFNPARLKLAMMRKEMPRRYWKNLPEAVLIQPLAARAAERSGTMIEQGASQPRRRRGVAPPIVPSPAAALAAPTATLDDIARGADRCRRCPIGAHATQAVPGAGPATARLMLVGEQPGDQEDLQGRPFVGPAGRLLDRVLARLGWPRDALYLTNAVKHFKHELRGKRRTHKTPAQQEVAACLHWLESEIALVKPAVAIALGATAARALLGRPVAVTAERGRWLERDDGLPVLVTLHPAALLRMPPDGLEAAFTQWAADLALAAPWARPAG